MCCNLTGLCPNNTVCRPESFAVRVWSFLCGDTLGTRNIYWLFERGFFKCSVLLVFFIELWLWNYHHFLRGRQSKKIVVEIGLPVFPVKNSGISVILGKQVWEECGCDCVKSLQYNRNWFFSLTLPDLLWIRKALKPTFISSCTCQTEGDHQFEKQSDCG